MKSNVFVSLLAITMLVITGASAMAEEQIPEVTVDGLHLVRDSNLSLVYARPGADLSGYNRVYLADAYVAFKKNWQQSRNMDLSRKVSASDMEKIKADLAALFRDVFTTSLEEGGYALVSERAEDVLIIKPAIINLDMLAPDVRSSDNVHTYGESAGEMTLYLEVYDSVTNALIAKAMDRRVDRKTGYIQWQNRVNNRAAARRIIQVWADVLKEGLDEAKATGRQ